MSLMTARTLASSYLRVLWCLLYSPSKHRARSCWISNEMAIFWWPMVCIKACAWSGPMDERRQHRSLATRMPTGWGWLSLLGLPVPRKYLAVRARRWQPKQRARKSESSRRLSYKIWHQLNQFLHCLHSPSHLIQLNPQAQLPVPLSQIPNIQQISLQQRISHRLQLSEL